MSGTPHHLLTVWDPSYASDAMDEHLRVLLHWAGEWKKGEADQDDMDVWWGKSRSPNRKGPLPHEDTIATIVGQVQTATETHLYFRLVADYTPAVIKELKLIVELLVETMLGRWAAEG